jgi:hypothetical protein
MRTANSKYCIHVHMLAVSLLGEPEQHSPPVCNLHRGSTMGKTRETFTRYV